MHPLGARKRRGGCVCSQSRLERFEWHFILDPGLNGNLFWRLVCATLQMYWINPASYTLYGLVVSQLGNVEDQMEASVKENTNEQTYE